ncbi:hypothetical protein HUU05_13675 [candidate division KSB1 bacterium]|nr:hypothetical protein [candidate division KSB1 bacterium]
MNDSSLTVTIVLFTAAIAFVVAKVAPLLRNDERKCPPCEPTSSRSPWLIKWGTISIRRREEIEENIQGIMPPEQK